MKIEIHCKPWALENLTPNPKKLQGVGDEDGGAPS